METTGKTATFQARELFGSRFRCLLLTHQPRTVVARLLTELVQPHAVIDPDRDRWMPNGLLDPDEAQLTDSDFLASGPSEIVKNWWLEVAHRANTPNWDLVSTCTMDGRPGLVLVEAKAHFAELSSTGKPVPTTPNGLKNHERVSAAVAEANAGLNAVMSGFALSAESHYQLCNRFAWSWKIASLGVPVVLVYLGFTNADDMAERGQSPFNSAAEWEDAVREYGRDIVPDAVWEESLDIEGTPVVSLIRAMDGRWRP